jgi:hypothetical protein
VCLAAVLGAAYFLAPGARGGASAPPASSQTALKSSSAPKPSSSKPAVTSEKTGKESGAVSESGKQTNNSSNTQGSDKVSGSSKTQSPSKVSSSGKKDKYQTDPTPAGKPKPQEPQETKVNPAKKHTCTFSIRCDTILHNMDQFKKDKMSVLPKNGVILATTTVKFSEGESVFDVLKRVTEYKRIQMEFENVPLYNSAYIEGIHNLYEFDCGPLSGWMYKVNGWFPNYGCSRYVLKQGDVVNWVYTCDLGKDVGGASAVGQGK